MSRPGEWGWICAFVLCAIGAHAVHAAEYTIRIAPQQAASELAKRWVPIIKYWSEATGISCQFRTAKDVGTFQADLQEGRYHIMFVNAHHCALFNRAPGYEAFAREIGCINAGVVVVPIASGAKGWFPAGGGRVTHLRHLGSRNPRSAYRAVAVR